MHGCRRRAERPQRSPPGVIPHHALRRLVLPRSSGCWPIRSAGLPFIAKCGAATLRVAEVSDLKAVVISSRIQMRASPRADDLPPAEYTSRQGESNSAEPICVQCARSTTGVVGAAGGRPARRSAANPLPTATQRVRRSIRKIPLLPAEGRYDIVHRYRGHGSSRLAVPTRPRRCRPAWRRRAGYRQPLGRVRTPAEMVKRGCLSVHCSPTAASLRHFPTKWVR